MKVFEIIQKGIRFFNSIYMREITLDDLRSKSRKIQIASARQKLMAYLSENKDDLRVTYEEIGMEFRRTHGTVIYAHDTVLNIIPPDKVYAEMVAYIEGSDKDEDIQVKSIANYLNCKVGEVENGKIAEIKAILER